jgi:hypothetical protein
MKTTTTASPSAGQSGVPQSAPTRQIWRSWGNRLAAKTAASLAALLLGAGLSYATTTEFVVNPGFESPGTDATAPPWYNQASWGGCTGAAVATEAHSGLQSWATSGAAAGAIDCVEQAVPIIPGGLKYAVSYWVKIPSASEATPAKVDIRAWFGTPSNLYIKDFWSVGGASGISITTPNWIQITDGVDGWTPTAECSQVLLRCRITSIDPSMVAYVDDASVTADVSYATVSGTVSEGGVGVAGAIVKAALTASPATFSSSAPSAADGSYSLQVIVGNEYKLTASSLPAGRAIASAPAAFTPADTTPLTGMDIVLGPLPGFSGYYAPANWDPILTVSDDPNPGNPAKVNTGEAPAAITLSAQQGTMWSGGTSFYLIPVPTSGALEFDWEYTAGVPNDSSVGYAVNPATASWGDAGQWDNPGGHPGCTILSGRNGSSITSGHLSIMVNAGDMIGFWAHNAFYNAAAQIRVSNFAAPDGVFHPITATAGLGGTISPLGTAIAPDGLNRTFTIMPSHGFAIADVLVDGVSAGALASYTFVGVTTDEHTIEAQFMELGKYSILASATAGGTISPSETVTLYEGDSQAYTITPNQYFDVTSVLVNGATEVSSGPSAQTYTLSNVTSSSTIDVVFSGWALTEISGVVTLDGAGLEGVAVTANGPRGPFIATTGSDGTYLIQVRPGDAYTLTAHKSGYIATPDSLTAGPGDLTGKDFTVVLNPPHPQPMFVSRGTGNWRNDTWTIGSRIKTGASAVFVSQLGYVDKDLNGLNVTHQVGIWDQAGVLLGSLTVPAGTDGELIGDFRYAPLDTVITLQPNSTYALGGFTQGDDWPDQAPAPGFNDPDFAGFTCEQAIARDGGVGFSNPNPNGGGFDWGASCAACNLIGTTLSGEDPYATWISRYPSLIGANALPGADPDGDGMTNQDEFAFGLNPTLGTSVNPIVVRLNKTSGQFSYTRGAASGLTYTVWTSANLVTWTRDTGATQTPAAPVNGVETVAVTLSGTKPLTFTKLFVRVAAQ